MAFVTAAEADEVDVFYETVGEYVDVIESIGWENSSIATGSTIVIWPNQVAEDANRNKSYADNALCLNWAMQGKGRQRTILTQGRFIWSMIQASRDCHMI